MKVFKMNDCDWWMAETKLKAIVAYLRFCSCKVSSRPSKKDLLRFEGAELDNVTEVTEAEMKETAFIVNPDSAKSSESTFWKELQRRIKANEPAGYFATTEL